MTLWRAHLVALAVTVIALLAIFARDAAHMAGLWWNSSTYQHCLFVLPLAAWLAWQRREAVALIQPRAWPPGLTAVALAALLWLLGEAAGVALFRHAALVLMVQASVLAILGPAAVRALAFPLFYLVFLVPFGDEFVPALQTLTAKMTIALVHLSGLPARIDGVFITTEAGWFEVAEACSGVKFLVAMVAYGALIANLCFRGWGRRAAFMALCVAAPVLANGIRAFATIYVAHLTSAEAATGFDHVVYGWFFFAAVAGLVLLIARPFFERRIGDPVEVAATDPVGSPRAPWPVVAAAVGIAALAPLWSSVATARVPLPNSIALPAMSGWTIAADHGGIAWTPAFAGADHRLYGRYRDARGRAVDVALALYGGQGEGREIVGFGQGVAPGWAWAADLPGRNECAWSRIAGPGRAERVQRTCYRVAGVDAASGARVKWLTLKARLTGGDPRAAVIIVSSADTQALHGFPMIDARALLDTAEGRR